MPDVAKMVKALRNAPNYNAGLGTSTIEDEAADIIEQQAADNAQQAARIAELEAALPVRCGDCVHCAWYADYCTDMRLPKNKRNRYICLKRSTLGENAVKAKLERDAIWVIDDENDFCSYGRKKGE